MCLIAWNWQSGGQQSLLLAANRDEFYARPTEPLHWWEGGEILAGRDLTAGGTWLGVSRSGRMAALTNYRSPADFRETAESRGGLVVGFLSGKLSAANYLDAILPDTQKYNAFNLLVWDGSQLMGLESRNARAFLIGPGIGAVSNADFYTPWPKLKKITQGLADLQYKPRPIQDLAAWSLLRDAQTAPDTVLPNTGIDQERERALSSAFIRLPEYGTRCSTLLRLEPGKLWLEERRYSFKGLEGSAQFSYSF